MEKLYYLYLVSDKQAFNSNFIIRDVLRTFSKDYMELYGLQGILKALRTKPTHRKYRVILTRSICIFLNGRLILLFSHIHNVVFYQFFAYLFS